MTNGDFKNLDEVEDIESHNVYAMAKSLGIPKGMRWKMIKRTSRDNARTPMQWTAEEGAGFTTGKPWLKINANRAEANVESESKKTDGVLAFWKRMIAERKQNEILCAGSFKAVYQGRRVFAFERELDGKKLLSVCNMTARNTAMPRSIRGGEVLISSYNEYDEGRLKPFEFRLVKVEEKQ